MRDLTRIYDAIQAAANKYADLLETYERTLECQQDLTNALLLEVMKTTKGHYPPDFVKQLIEMEFIHHI